MHAAHGIADDEANMVQTETLGEQAILRVNHVGVIVFGEFRFQTIGRLQAFAVSDAVGDDDIIFGGVQRLARAEQLTGKIRGKHTGGRAATAVKHQHRLTGKARLSWCSANAARAAHFAGMKFKNRARSNRLPLVRDSQRRPPKTKETPMRSSKGSKEASFGHLCLDWPD